MSATAKDIKVINISAPVARAFVKRWHYSHTSVRNSQLHFGAVIGDRLVGAMQFGPPMDKRKVLGLVRDTAWNDMLELNRMVMLDDTPPNSESRFLGVALRLVRRQYPNIEWVLSFADATQCGDGTIYRATGFVLTQVKANSTIYLLNGKPTANMTMSKGPAARARNGRASIIPRTTLTTSTLARANNGAAGSKKVIEEMGLELLPGFQMRYIKFLNPAARSRLTIPEVPYARIAELQAGMYKGRRKDYQ